MDRSILATLSHQGITKPTILSHIDLAEPFETVTQWTFVAVQDIGKPIDESDDDQGPVSLCLVKAARPDCAQHLYKQVGSKLPELEPHHLFTGKVVYAHPNKSKPLLLLAVCGPMIFDGNCEIATALYRYDNGADRFRRVFLNLTGRNNNESTWFVERGPLQGDVIVNYPTENAPYTYWIEVYRADDSEKYVQILRYRGHTGYSDGNPLAVADSEMPEILRRLGLWHPGDELPVPDHLPQGCRNLSMRNQEEWCK